MTLAENIVARVENAGGKLALRGERIRVQLPQDAAGLIDELRARREEVVNLLRARASIPEMPPGVRLLAWNLKDPPIAIDAPSVVFNPSLFARSTLEQLRAALADPKRRIGWTVPQLIERLAQVGVIVANEPDSFSTDKGRGVEP
jgi:hypothetical protein